jgi:hypothetical protein
VKNFTVTVGGQSMTMPGPDDATQEQAQAEAERQMQAKQSADLKRDLSGPGRAVANFAQGAAELVGEPARAAGAQPGPLYTQAEAAPTTTGDKIARFAGASLPLAPLGAAGVGAARGVGALEGASVPTDSPTERAINTGVGAFFGGFGRGAPGSSALDRLAGTAMGLAAGHGLGGGLATILGGSLGSRLGHSAHEAVADMLRQYPPSVVARAVASLGEPVSRILAQQYDYLNRGPSDGQSSQ